LESRVFLTFLLVDEMIRILEAFRLTDPVDPDPEHCLFENASVPRQKAFQNNSNRGPVPLKIRATLIYDEYRSVPVPGRRVPYLIQ
jgi:hypothetical protein